MRALLPAFLLVACGTPQPPPPATVEAPPPAPAPSVTAAPSTVTSASSAAPIASASVAPPPPPKTLLDGELPEGCFGSTSDAYVCVLGHNSIQEGGQYAVDVVSSGKRMSVPLVSWPGHTFDQHSFALSKEARGKVDAALGNKMPDKLPDPICEIEVPGKCAIAEKPSLEVRVKRIQLKPVSMMSGSWKVFRDVVEIVCAGGKPKTVLDLKLENAVSTVKVWVGPAGTMLQHEMHYGIEGDNGSAVRALRIDRTACTTS